MTDTPRKPDPIRPPDDEARALARRLIRQARHGALGVRDPETGSPSVSRVAVAPGPDGLPMSLVSDLSHHSRALKADPVCSLLLGEPCGKGDPLTWPRITLAATASFVRHGDPDHAALATLYLARQPKAKLYIDFGDFSILRFAITGAALNGGFGKAYALGSDDLRQERPDSVSEDEQEARRGGDQNDDG